MSEMVERVGQAIFLATIKDGSLIDFRECAQAAIEALRIPTQAMILAAAGLNHPRDEEIWKAMIDAALGDAL